MAIVAEFLDDMDEAGIIATISLELSEPIPSPYLLIGMMAYCDKRFGEEQSKELFDAGARMIISQ